MSKVKDKQMTSLLFAWPPNEKGFKRKGAYTTLKKLVEGFSVVLVTENTRQIT